MVVLEHVTGLAIIGLQVIAPGVEGIETFGHLVYRSSTPVRKPGEKIDLDAAAQACARGVLQSAALSEGQAQIVTLSGGVETEGSSIEHALGQAADWLELEETELVVLVETNPGEGWACALLLTLERFALDNGKTIYAVIGGAAQAGVGQPDLLGKKCLPAGHAIGLGSSGVDWAAGNSEPGQSQL